MTATSHAVTGAAVATLVRQPLLALPLAFISHFVSDMVPHFGIDSKFGSRSMFWRLGIDGVVTVCIAIFLLISGVANAWFLALAGFIAMSPDLMWLYHGLKKHSPADYGFFSRMHSGIQLYEKPLGIVIEIVWVAGCLIIIL